MKSTQLLSKLKAPKVLNPRRNQLRKLCNTSLPVRLKVLYMCVLPKLECYKKRGLQTH